jgi:hypothetical protein
MPNNWLAIRIELLHGRGTELDPPPGRVFLVGPKDTFAQLADAINKAFARWDHGHLHSFELHDGRQIGIPEGDWDSEFEDEAATTVASSVGKGDRFRYIFDFGDDWTHECVVDRDEVDPVEQYGEVPVSPVPIWGWGWIPDQYGRQTSDEEE